VVSATMPTVPTTVPTTGRHDLPPAARAMRVTALYADRLNLYADRGNLIVLAQRCRRRGIAFELTTVGVGDRTPLEATRPDLVYLGGGQDRDQRACAVDLRRHREAIAGLAAGGAAVLGICGGYQLLGHEYVTPEGTIAGVGLLDVTTVRGAGPRLVGNAVIDVGAGRLLAGFENHQGRTTLGAGSRPLGTVLSGHGNDGDGGTEGAVSGTVIGTYLHGPLLAKNAWFADRLIAAAVGAPADDGGAHGRLGALDDRFAEAVHRRAVALALSERRR